MAKKPTIEEVDLQLDNRYPPIPGWPTCLDDVEKSTLSTSFADPMTMEQEREYFHKS